MNLLCLRKDDGIYGDANYQRLIDENPAYWVDVLHARGIIYTCQTITIPV